MPYAESYRCAKGTFRKDKDAQGRPVPHSGQFVKPALPHFEDFWPDDIIYVEDLDPRIIAKYNLEVGQITPWSDKLIWTRDQRS